MYKKRVLEQIMTLISISSTSNDGAGNDRR